MRFSGTILRISCGTILLGAVLTATPTFAGQKKVALTNEYIQRLGTTEYPEGGIWYHNVDSPWGSNIKSVVSNYQHNSKKHRSSCDIGGYNEDHSKPDWSEPGNEAKSSTSGPKEYGTAHAYYDTK